MGQEKQFIIKENSIFVCLNYLLGLYIVITQEKTYFLNSRGSLKSTLSMKPSSNSRRPKNNKKVVNNSAHVQFNPVINLGLGQIADSVIIIEPIK